MSTQPTPSPGHELCEKADPDLSHYWCCKVHGWNLIGWPACSGEFWQKPVKVAVKTSKTPITDSSEYELLSNVRRAKVVDASVASKIEKELAQAIKEKSHAEDELKKLMDTYALWPDRRDTVANLEQELAQARAEMQTWKKWQENTRQCGQDSATERDRLKSELELERKRNDAAHKEIEYLKSRPPQWPAPISTNDRLPTEKDAVNGYVLYLNPISLWFGCKWQDVSTSIGFWLTPPPIPQSVKVKDEAEIAWEKFSREESVFGENAKKYFLTAFKSGKESK